MLGTLYNHSIGVISFLIYVVNTIFWFVPIFIMSFMKVIPIKIWQTALSYLLDGCASAWISVNNFNQKITGGTRFIVEGIRDLKLNDWYLVISNHRSWVDILVLQRVFNRKIPFLKFFLKRELIWVPFLGIAWWALDFPFMRRYSKAFLAKYPHLRGKDLQTTRKACEKFRYKPVSIMNFVEGTRFTEKKHALQNSPYTHLLKPRCGGVAFVLSTMGSQLHKLLDVTILYPQGTPTFWEFLCGKVKQVKVSVNVLSVDELLQSDAFAMDYFDNPEQRQKFQLWLNQLWHQKDETIKEMSVSKS